MPELRLIVNGVRYAGWKTAQVTRGVESISGGFSLSVSERWGGQDEPWPIVEGDECKLFIGDVPVITGYVDRRSPSYTADDHTLAVSGRDATGDLVDSSALLDKWEFKDVPLLTFARRLCEPFGIDVELQPGLVIESGGRSQTLGHETRKAATPTKKALKMTVDPGDTVFEALDRACRLAAVLPVSDGLGGLILTRTGSTRCTTALVQGENILGAGADYDASGRFRRYVVLGQRSGSDTDYGASVAGVKGEAQDLNVGRAARTLVIRAEGAVTREYARRRAEWDAKVRAARGDAVSVRVQGWTEGDGTLWPVNALVPVRSAWLGIDGEMLITQATYSLDGNGGTTTELALRRPDAFLPEPVVMKGGSGGLWKELAKGV
jgi:prophage tail gpP-like protein